MSFGDMHMKNAISPRMLDVKCYSNFRDGAFQSISALLTLNCQLICDLLILTVFGWRDALNFHKLILKSLFDHFYFRAIIITTAAARLPPFLYVPR